ncbi:hypothetical protein EV378_1023 [Pseudonocardia endophytica]|uniref:NACHT domain-containing protein n=2 Tax=Pseudonocardia endophytica TaxID=401976 RepID=A0A4R1HV20_PSEEN|nr:hypothetical protein EV378_1023 [Pseudonocardia endophytica]
MVQALALDCIGPGIQVFGRGPDGGREATFDGEVHLDGKAKWDGYGVIQAKYRDRLTGTSEDQKWFFEQVTAELDAWIKPTSRRKLNPPKYLIIATNVPLTAVAESGGIDRLDKLVTVYRDMQDKDGNRIGLPDLLDHALWHAEYLDRLLEGSEDIRHAYADLVLPGDVLSRLFGVLDGHERRIAESWIGHLSRAIADDSSVELGESGDMANTPLKLADVAVDLPAQTDSASLTTAISAVIARSDHILHPALHPAANDRMIMLGGPGSGKSTLSRIICQIYRSSMLASYAPGHITRQTSRLAGDVQQMLLAGGLSQPTLHRLPVRVVLGKYADAVSKFRQLTLLQHVTDLINQRASEDVSVADVKALMRKWPTLVALDGLDEVSSASVRADVSIKIADFLEEMAAAQIDIMMLCTSRPIGYEDDPRVDFEHLNLVPLSTQDAIRYARRLLEKRFEASPERQEQTLQRLSHAAKSDDTAKVMTTPLQVTILALILEQRTRAPASRWALFSAYYDTIFARECNKAGELGVLLERYRSQVNGLHEQCALTIHCRAEREGQAESILPIDAVERIARDILVEDGYTSTDIDPLIGQLLRLARERLVLMVPRQSGVAFEVRSLTEFFAARALMAGEDAADRLQTLITSAHWSNTWLLASGYIFNDRRGMRDAVVARLDRIDQLLWAHRLVMPGAALAIDALADGFAAHAPGYELQLTQSAMRLLNGPIGEHITRLARTLAPLMAESRDIRSAVNQEVDARIAQGTPGSLRAFLSGLVDSDTDAIAAAATSKLADYDEERGPELHPDYTSDATDEFCIGEDLNSRLVSVGTPKRRLTASSDPSRILTISYDGTPATAWVIPAREILIEYVMSISDKRSQIRKILSDAMQRDDVSYSLLEDG